MSRILTTLLGTLAVCSALAQTPPGRTPAETPAETAAATAAAAAQARAATPDRFGILPQLMPDPSNAVYGTGSGGSSYSGAWASGRPDEIRKTCPPGLEKRFNRCAPPARLVLQP